MSRQPQAELESWQRANLPRWRVAPRAPAVSEAVTALAYCFWPAECLDERFFTIEAALRATWAQCGRLRTKLVTSLLTPRIAAFCEAEGVACDVAPALSGNLRAMSDDCIRQLHRRFETPYVLIVQNDGFPLRPGLEAFVGPYDYVGAPWPRPTWYTGLLFPYPRFAVGNGGFSLRSRTLCETVAWHATHRYRLLPSSWFRTEDIFYARVLRRCEGNYRRTMRFAPPEIAAQFAVEHNWALCQGQGGRPFGFHSAPAFVRAAGLTLD